MLLLVTDTSGRYGSVALARAGEASSPGGVDVIESVPLAGGTFSAQLVPQIAALLSKHGVSKSDIDAFVVVSGPGSFTGLRVGLAAIKALSEILGKPIVPVSLLEVLAVLSGTQGNVVALLDAGRGEVYVGEYKVDDSAQVLAESIVTKAEFLAKWGGSRQTIVTSDSALAEFLASEGLQVSTPPAVDAGAIARLGWKKIRAGRSVSPEELEANYIRRSDAEIFGKPNV